MTTRLVSFVLVALFCSATAARAQTVDLGVVFAGSQWSEFEGMDLGVGGRLGWRPIPLIGVESELTWYPREFPDDIAAFSGHRVEGMLAVTAGPRLNRLRPFVRAGAGFLKSSGAPRPFACIAIFPPPLNCLLGAGDTLPSFEIGGGLEFSTPGSTFLRIDVGDRILKYPAPTFSRDFKLRDSGFFGHALRVSAGGGIRF